MVSELGRELHPSGSEYVMLKALFSEPELAAAVAHRLTVSQGNAQCKSTVQAATEMGGGGYIEAVRRVAVWFQFHPVLGHAHTC